METSESPNEAVATSVETIKGMIEPVVLRYFETLNAGEFEATAALFDSEGSLKPPFEAAVVGPVAIATYLEQEAKGIKLLPRQGAIELENGQRQAQVSGKVQTSLFTVNVVWTFVLNDLDQIVSARIKLLASPKELLNLRQ